MQPHLVRVIGRKSWYDLIARESRNRKIMLCRSAFRNSLINARFTMFLFLYSYGDLHAITLEEKWISIFSMLVGIGLFFGLILGGMASMLTNLDSARARYIHHLKVIKDHMVRLYNYPVT